CWRSARHARSGAASNASDGRRAERATAHHPRVRGRDDIAAGGVRSLDRMDSRDGGGKACGVPGRTTTAGRRCRWTAPVLLALCLLVAVPTVALAAGDPYRDQQWALDHVGVEQAWETSGRRGDDVIVAVVDTGVDLGHP